MKKVFSIMFVLLILIAAVPRQALAQNTLECCCDVTCYCETKITHKEKSITFNKCSAYLLLKPFLCDPDDICRDICEVHLLNVWFDFAMEHYSGSCSIPTDCAAESVLGENDARLDKMRRFRDKVLGKTAVGKKLKDFYYEHSPTLVLVFQENPSLQEHAKELLEKLAPRIGALLTGKVKGPILDAELYAEAEMLLDEIDSVLASPLKKDLMALKDEAREAGMVE